MNFRKQRAKSANFVLTLDGTWKAKSAPKISSKCFMDRICKIKQYLNYVNWLSKSKYSSSPKDILKSEKKRKTLHLGDNFYSCKYWISKYNS